jgi:hypothetical protein
MILKLTTLAWNFTLLDPIEQEETLARIADLFHPEGVDMFYYLADRKALLFPEEETVVCKVETGPAFIQRHYIASRVCDVSVTILVFSARRRAHEANRCRIGSGMAKPLPKCVLKPFQETRSAVILLMRARFKQDRVGSRRLRTVTLPHHRTCGFPHPAVEPGSGVNPLRPAMVMKPVALLPWSLHSAPLRCISSGVGSLPVDRFLQADPLLYSPRANLSR